MFNGGSTVAFIQGRRDGLDMFTFRSVLSKDDGQRVSYVSRGGRA